MDVGGAGVGEVGVEKLHIVGDETLHRDVAQAADPDPGAIGVLADFLLEGPAPLRRQSGVIGPDEDTDSSRHAGRDEDHHGGAEVVQDAEADHESMGNPGTIARRGGNSTRLVMEWDDEG